MARRWFVDNSGVIQGFTDNDAVAVPAAHAAVQDAVIRLVDPPGATGRIRQGGTWDGASYAPPSGGGILVAYDPTTELGRKQIAASALHTFLHEVSATIHAVRHEKPQVDVANVEQFIAMAHHANYVVAHMATVTIDLFEAWAAAMMLHPMGITNAQGYFETVHGAAANLIPQEANAWAAPLTGDIVLLQESRHYSQGDNTQPGWFVGEVVDLTSTTLGNGAWIRALT